mmetsp:Transcript_68742/g.206181  ORF Transcript_68742/g.206181 Transcript_68742/m.206181 type:complete len:215 (+) Transcript_68742:143-787(+)
MHGLGSHTLMRDNDEGTKLGSCTLCTTTARLSPCEKPSDPLTNAGLPGGRPDSAPADAPAGREGARRRTSRAFALDQRPVTNSITASPARPRARRSMPRLANSKASSVLTFRLLRASLLPRSNALGAAGALALGAPTGVGRVDAVLQVASLGPADQGCADAERTQRRGGPQGELVQGGNRSRGTGLGAVDGHRRLVHATTNEAARKAGRLQVVV